MYPSAKQPEDARDVVKCAERHCSLTIWKRVADTSWEYSVRFRSLMVAENVDTEAPARALWGSFLDELAGRLQAPYFNLLQIAIANPQIATEDPALWAARSVEQVIAELIHPDPQNASGLEHCDVIAAAVDATNYEETEPELRADMYADLQSVIAQLVSAGTVRLAQMPSGMRPNEDPGPDVKVVPQNFYPASGFSEKDDLLGKIQNARKGFREQTAAQALPILVRVVESLRKDWKITQKMQHSGKIGSLSY